MGGNGRADGIILPYLVFADYLEVRLTVGLTKKIDPRYQVLVLPWGYLSEGVHKEV